MSFFINRWVAGVLDGKSPQEYAANACIFQGSVLGPLLFLHHINNHHVDIFCNTATHANNTTLYSVDFVFCFVATGIAFQIKSDLRVLVNWDIKWLFYFNAE